MDIFIYIITLSFWALVAIGFNLKLVALLEERDKVSLLFRLLIIILALTWPVAVGQIIARKYMKDL